ncbi:MAG TPA: hypothetical protein VMS96_08395 [Terriglobales bacterium]|nr:hypothetical protein [Terriglobales bacterium]
MRAFSTFLLLCLTAAAWAADAKVPACPAPPGAPCAATPEDEKAARKAFNRGVWLRDQERHEQAFDAFERASRLAPNNVDYATAREVAKQQLVYDFLERGNRFMLDRQQVQALAEFRAALELDPKNDFAMQRLRDALGDEGPRPSPALRLVASADDVQLQPGSGTMDLRYRGDSRTLVENIAANFKVVAVFDDSFQTRQVKVDLPRLTFRQAMFVAAKLGKFFWAPISGNQFVVASDVPENRRRLERMSLRSYYVSDATSPGAVGELVGMLRNLFDIRLISPQNNQSMITIRAPKDTVDAVTRFLDGFAGGPPQVMLDVKVFEVNSDALRDLGIELPLQWRLFSLGGALSQLQNQPNIQQLINQLFAGGGINQANAQGIQALLAQLQNQTTSILSSPVATFGGGLTLMALQPQPMTGHFQFNESSVKTLEHVTMRARQGDTSSMLIGTRYPILNASFSPIYNTPAIAQVIQNNSFREPFPSFSFENLGISLKATPQVHANDDISLKMEMQVRSLTGQAFNGVPVVSNREYNGTINLKDGETALMAGYVTRSEQRSLSGLPGLGQVAGLGLLVSEETNENTADELLVLVTPHIIQASDRQNTEVWMEK